MRLPRRRLLALALALPIPAQAQPPPDSPTAPIAAFNAALRAGMTAGRATPFATRAARLRPVIERVFDLPALLAASVGPRFAGFSAAARADLLEAFTAFTVATWVANFDTDAGERIELAPDTRPIGADQVVTTRIIPPTGEPTRLDYVMRQTPTGWRVVDILLNGTISRVAVQRSDFRSLVAAGDPAPLLASLRSRAAQLAGGTAN
ncbi:MAG: ABC transporter substrate-binding protein [Acetobacteraceae bacterium]|nr:ABC transporter substrate-binding protein [Acetobacteraceae bacterium]